MSATSAEHTVTLHGHAFSYTDSGSGPVLLFIHGLLGSQKQWAHLVDELDEDHRLIVPDLFGHGESAKPVGDYSLGAHAATLRDLLDRLGIEQVTLVGHSLGGGIAMVFSYLFPERVERLVLVASGGLGREVSPLLRSATLPGAEYVLPVIASGWMRDRIASAGRLLGSVGLRPGSDVREVWTGFTSLGDGDTRRAFLATTRAVIDPGGQSVSAHDYLPDATPDPDPRRVGDQGPDDPGLARRLGDDLDRELPGRAVPGGRALPAPRRPRPVRRAGARVRQRVDLSRGSGDRCVRRGQLIWSQSVQPLCSTSQAIRP